jgi:hypothetical protein
VNRLPAAALAALGIVAGAILTVQAALVAGWVILFTRAAATEDALREQLVVLEARLALLEKRLDGTIDSLQLLPERSAEQVARAMDQKLQSYRFAAPHSGEEPQPASPWIP